MNRKIVIVIGGALTKSRLAHLIKLVKIIRTASFLITVIYEGKISKFDDFDGVCFRSVGTKPPNNRSSITCKILQYIKYDLKKIRLLSKEMNDGAVFLFLGIFQPISVLFVWLLRGNSMLFGGGFDYRVSYSSKGKIRSLYFSLIWMFQILLLRFFKKIIFETPSVHEFYKLEKFKHKSVHNGHLFVDLQRFKPLKDIKDRGFDIGFIGVLDEVKGIIQFIRSARLLIEERKIRVLIVGNGYFHEYIKQFFIENQIQNFVEIRDSVEYSEMHDIYNEIKLLVIPSKSEGLPNVAIEAMACGTPVLASPVGGIPDIIHHQKTGFILPSTQSSVISRSVGEILDNSSLLESVSRYACLYVNQEFTIESSQEIWRKILLT